MDELRFGFIEALRKGYAYQYMWDNYHKFSHDGLADILREFIFKYEEDEDHDVAYELENYTWYEGDDE